jgi:quercetin dioxygenase-like cupin family protein
VATSGALHATTGSSAMASITPRTDMPASCDGTDRRTSARWRKIWVSAFCQTSEVIENERTGERVEFLVESDDLLRMEVTWSKPGHRSIRHAHPGMEERWKVLEGRAAFEVDGVLVEAGRGSWVVAPAGRPHLAWNPTDEPVRLVIEMRPALRWAEFVRRYFSGEDDVVRLLEEFDHEIVLAPITSQ